MTRLKIFLLFMVIANLVSAQSRQLSGVVTDVNKKGLPGVTIQVKDGNGRTITNNDGGFTFSVPSGDIALQLSSVGYATKDIVVGSADDNIVISLTLNSTDLGEVVVTALGIKREKKALPYASQTVGGDELRKAGNINFMDALSGKAAGVNISTSASGAGGSTKAVLRGNRSLTGLSEPLYVIDGVPMVNNKGAQPGSYGGTDQGDGLSAINPDDIESMTVLRGANASILYGSQGANGVVLITTKKGRPGKAVVSFNSSTVFDQVSGIPDLQYEYGAVNGSDYNWSTTKGSYQRGYVEDFFQTGVNTANAISVSAGGDKTTVYFSFGNTYATGVMPGNSYTRNNISFNQSTRLLNDKLVLSSSVMLSSEVSRNRPGAGYYNNPLTGLYLFARERDFENYKTNYSKFDSTRNFGVMNWYSSEEKQNNPYWEINKNSKLGKTLRAITSVKAAYSFSPQWKLEARANIDYANKLFDNRWAAGGNSVSISHNGSWNYQKYNDQSIYADAILSYVNRFNDFSLTSLVGASYLRNVFSDGMNVANGTNALIYPDFFSFTNIPTNVGFNQSISRVLKQGVFANVTVGFKDIIFLDIAGRNDWASTLALTGNQSYFYPSIGASAIISEMLTLPEAITFFKARASYSVTANEVPFNVVHPNSSINSTSRAIDRPTQFPFNDLKPEKIASDEYGIEMRFFNGRLGFDATYYSNVSTNQFLSLPAPSGSGYTTMYINAGKITNKGLEVSFTADVIKKKNLSWKSAINFSRNKNKIVELIPTDPGYKVGGDDEGFASIIMAGGAFNDVWIYKFNRNAEGQIILSSAGIPTKAAAMEKIGNVNPDFLVGFNNTVAVKNFFVSALVNGKFGGVAFSKTEAFLDAYGVSKRSADDRANATMLINAIQGTTKVTSIAPKDYYSSIGDRNRIMEPYVFSRTNVRLAQLVLGYNIPIKNRNGFIKEASASVIGRNLFFFYKKAPYDPEQAMSTNNSMQSNDVFSVPATRSYGINFKITF